MDVDRLAEFQRAYALIPAPTVLYNLGLVYAALHRPVQAKRALEQVLAHPESLRPEDASRARAVLNDQVAFIGFVSVITNVKQGTIEIDNVEVAKLPLAAPLAVASGARVIGVVSPGYAPARREVLVAGGQIVRAQLELIGIEGRLAHVALSCRAPAADVFVDGVRVGRTPLAASVTVAPGVHRVAVRRAGYARMKQSITLQDGAVGNLNFTPTVDAATLSQQGGVLNVQVSEHQSVVSIDDGEAALLVNPLHARWPPSDSNRTRRILASGTRHLRATGIHCLRHCRSKTHARYARSIRH